MLLGLKSQQIDFSIEILIVTVEILLRDLFPHSIYDKRVQKEKEESPV